MAAINAASFIEISNVVGRQCEPAPRFVQKQVVVQVLPKQLVVQV
jgi:hypothetical protein